MPHGIATDTKETVFKAVKSATNSSGRFEPEVDGSTNRYSAGKRLYDMIEGDVPVGYSAFQSIVKALEDEGRLEVVKHHARDIQAIVVTGDTKEEEEVKPEVEPAVNKAKQYPGKYQRDRLANFLRDHGGIYTDPKGVTAAVAQAVGSTISTASALLTAETKAGRIDREWGDTGDRMATTAIMLVDDDAPKGDIKPRTPPPAEEEVDDEGEPEAPEGMPDEDIDYTELATALLRKVLAVANARSAATQQVKSLRTELDETKIAYGEVKAAARELEEKLEDAHRVIARQKEDLRQAGDKNERLRHLLAQAEARDDSGKTSEDIRTGLPLEQRRKLAELRKMMTEKPSPR